MSLALTQAIWQMYVLVIQTALHFLFTLHLMPGGGGYMKTAELRTSVRAELHLPSNAKFYICAQALYKFHPIFDDALLAILERDQSAHLLILDDLDRTIWQTHVY